MRSLLRTNPSPTRSCNPRPSTKLPGHGANLSFCTLQASIKRHGQEWNRSFRTPQDRRSEKEILAALVAGRRGRGREDELSYRTDDRELRPEPPRSDLGWGETGPGPAREMKGIDVGGLDPSGDDARKAGESWRLFG